MLVLLWWLIPIGAVAVATWWVYAIAPGDARSPDRPKSRRELDRIAHAIRKPLPNSTSTAARSDEQTVDLRDRDVRGSA